MSLRIAHVSAVFPPHRGGTATVCFELASQLAARGHQVDVFTAREPEPPPPTPATVHALDPVFAFGNAPLLPQLARLRGMDLIHLHYPFIFGTELLLLGAARRIPLVLTYHNELLGEGARRPLFALYERTWGRAVLRRARRTIVVSDAHADTVAALRGLRRRAPQKVVAVPNGVDLDRFAPGDDGGRLRERLGIPPGAPVLAFVAALDRAHYFKRLDLALEALRFVCDRETRLIVVGDGELRARYEAHAVEAGLRERVQFVGGLDHDALPGALRAADALVFPSEPPESFGLVVIEAMACGLPVIMSDLPGPRSIVRPDETALVAPRGDAAALAAAIDALFARSEDARRAMGRAARRLCEERYAWPRVADRVEAVYRDALASPLP